MEAWSRGIRERVRDAYSAAALEPRARHPFPAGRAFAESVGYGADLLDRLPAVSAEAFTGVSNVSVFAEIQPGAAVLDVGCGAGLDTLIAAQRTGPAGRVIGLDFSASMLSRARRGASEAAAARVLFCQADAERLPLPAGRIDVALANGIFNLNPARQALMRELARVLRHGGALYAAELILLDRLPEELRGESDWFA